MQAGDGIIPSPLWLLLFVTAGLMFVFAFLFAHPGESWLPQSVIAATIAAMLATSLLVISFLNNPFTPGTGSLKPTNTVKALRVIEEASRALGLRVPIPCDAAGRPLQT